jgi:hypothetical protein
MRIAIRFGLRWIFLINNLNQFNDLERIVSDKRNEKRETFKNRKNNIILKFDLR